MSSYFALARWFRDWIVANHPHLAEWWEGYDPAAHETQINVNAKSCDRLYTRQRRGSSLRWLVPDVDRDALSNLHTNEDLDDYCTHPDGIVTALWEGSTFPVGNFRIPHGTHTDNPSFRDRPVIGPIHHHWDRIGTSGWNWRDKKSEWVGFDYDAICKSKNGNGLTDEQLAEIKDRVRDVPWVTVRTSTGGKGLHLIVRADEPPTTRNHDAHAEFAEYVLGKLSHACGFSFAGSVDVYGRILWHYSKEVNEDCLKRID